MLGRAKAKVRRREIGYDEAAEQQKYRALREALETADVFRIRRAMFAGQTSSYVFQRNFHELMSFVDLHYKLQSEGKLGYALNREPLYEFLHELTRRLHNFVFAAVCFVQHTDNFVREIHGDAPPIKAPYDVEFNRHFGSGIHGFTVTLRDFFAHNATPFVQSVFGGSDATITEEYTVELNGSEFCEFAKKREGKRKLNRCAEVSGSQ